MANYLTPAEIIKKYPQLLKLNWNDRALGIFLKAKLLLGYYDTNFRAAMIDEESVKALVCFANQVIDSQKLTI